MNEPARIAYEGDPALRQPVMAALQRVVDPEMAMSIMDVGLVYGVEARDDRVRIELTMTSAACPVADLIVDEIDRELRAALSPDLDVDVALVWEPPWTPERLSARARMRMGW